MPLVKSLWHCGFAEAKGAKKAGRLCAHPYIFLEMLPPIFLEVLQLREGLEDIEAKSYQIIHPDASSAVSITRSLLTFCGEFQVMARNKLSVHVWERKFL